MKFSKFLCFALLFVTWSCTAQPERLSKKKISEINDLVENLSKDDAFSGTVLIAKGNTIVYQVAVGFADKAQKSLNKIDTKFNVGSINKMFTSVAIAQLVEKKKLDFGDKLITHLPNLPAQIFGDITIEQLLTHTAGTGDFFAFSKFESIADTAKTIGTYVNIGLDEPLLFKPSTKVKYSNYGFILLGAVIEQLSGMTYDNYVKKHIFDVANMNNTDSYERDKAHDNLAIGYMSPPHVPGQIAAPMPVDVKRAVNTKELEVKGNSAGGGYSTVVDFHKFSMALMSGKLVSPEMLTRITTGKVILLPAIPKANLPEVKYAYGFGEIYKNKTRLIGHTGGAPGVDAQLEIYPDLDYTVVALSNYDRATMPIMRLIQDIITGE